MTLAPARAGALLAAAWLAAGCASSPGGVTIAPHSGPLIGDVEIVGTPRDVEVRFVAHWIFWVPTRATSPSLADAIEEALERGNGQLLVDARVERIAWYVPFLYGEFGWKVSGRVVQVRKRPPPPTIGEP